MHSDLLHNGQVCSIGFIVFKITMSIGLLTFVSGIYSMQVITVSETKCSQVRFTMLTVFVVWTPVFTFEIFKLP